MPAWRKIQVRTRIDMNHRGRVGGESRVHLSNFVRATIDGLVSGIREPSTSYSSGHAFGSGGPSVSETVFANYVGESLVYGPLLRVVAQGGLF